MSTDDETWRPQIEIRGQVRIQDTRLQRRALSNILRTFISFGPAAIPVAWLLAGQWTSASQEQHAWLQLTSAVCLAIAIPIPGARDRGPSLVTLTRVWAWSTAAGLLVMP